MQQRFRSPPNVCFLMPNSRLAESMEESKEAFFSSGRGKGSLSLSFSLVVSLGKSEMEINYSFEG